MDLDPFSQGASFLHRADARLKLLALVPLATAAALCARPRAAALALGLALVLVLLARLPWRALLRRLAMVNLFILLCWATVPLGPAGPDSLVTLGPVGYNRSGLDLALLITLKSNALVLLLIALAATTPPASLGRALSALGVPDRLCLLLLFTYRYIHVIQEEYARRRRAVLLRGFIPSTSLHCYRTHAHLVGMTLLGAWNRAARVRQAMVLRGFDGRFHALDTGSFRPLDLLLPLAALLGAVAVLCLERGA